MREIAVAPLTVPAALAEVVAGYDWARDMIGESGGVVHHLHATGCPDLYLKSGTDTVADAIDDEQARLRWLGTHVSVPSVLGFVREGDTAWLLMTAIPGRTAYQCLADDPANRPAIVTAIARHLRSLHALPIDDCPFDSGHARRLAEARRRIDAGEVDTDDFDDARAGWTAEHVWQAMTAHLPLAPDPVVTHGDYSLDNILLLDGTVTGCIDVGRAGIADRWQDIAIVWNGLGEFDAGLQALFLSGYGIAPDHAKLEFHLCLDEMF